MYTYKTLHTHVVSVEDSPFVKGKVHNDDDTTRVSPFWIKSATLALEFDRGQERSRRFRTTRISRLTRLPTNSTGTKPLDKSKIRTVFLKPSYLLQGGQCRERNLHPFARQTHKSRLCLRLGRSSIISGLQRLQTNPWTVRDRELTFRSEGKRVLLCKEEAPTENRKQQSFDRRQTRD